MDAVEFDSTNRRLMVSGDLTFTTVPAVNVTGITLMDKDNELVFDFQNVKRCDSSGLALLTSWMRTAKQKNKSVCFINLPQQLLAIARACRLEQVLPIVTTNS